MPPMPGNVVADVINLDSDDDDDNGVVGGGTEFAAPSNKGVFRSVASLMEDRKVSSTISDAVVVPQENLEFRSFWKAGEISGRTSISSTPQGALEHARVHPKFLHSNATSHKWAFGAIAELLDNAVDEIQNGATFVKVDKIDIVKDNSPALVFLDDGAGMDPDGIRKCMSLGYSSKKSNTTIGQYGNGFKTSTMRLGADAIVFTRATRAGKSTQSIGLLSYTFLRKTGQDDVTVPMIDTDLSKDQPQPIIYGSPEDWVDNLEIILKWSPFSTQDELLQQFEDIGTHGTKVIIFNLWLNDEGIYELSFDDDDGDIRLRDEGIQEGKRLSIKHVEIRSHISYRLRFSLRAYASMLYLKKFNNFKIILRGIPVEQFNIADEFRYPETIIYKPHAAVEQAATEIKVGFIKEAPKLPVSGFNVYHKNRLIRPFWKVTLDGSSRGNGVVGVLEANFIEPAHDKQDFERSSLFQRLESKLKKIIIDFWCSRGHVFGFQYNKSKRIATPEPLTVNTYNPAPPDKTSQGGPIIREISLAKPTSSRPVTVTPPHLRNTASRGTFEPVQLTPRTTATTDTTRNNNLVGNLATAATTDTTRNNNLVGNSATAATTDTQNNNLVGKSATDISQENIQLFMRCEEYTKKETELEQTVKDLEKELEEAKSKCTQLAILVAAKKKEMQQV